MEKLYEPLLPSWIPTLLMIISLGGSFLFFMFIFILFRGLARLSYLKEISLTLKRIEKIIESKNKTT